jgi:polyisoprenoid-binding protein YceI
MVRRPKRLIRWIVAAVVVVVVVAIAAPFIYIHFIEGPPPAKLSLPSAAHSDTTSAPGVTGSAGSLDGTWNVGQGSIAGYRVQEVLIGQQSTAVGRSRQIWGSLVIAGQTVTKGSFSVDMASVESDQSERNAQFDGRIMDVSAYPTATLTLTTPIALGSMPLAERTVEEYHGSGDLSMHGVTRSITFTVTAERVGQGVDVLADIPITFSDWNIGNPSLGSFVTTENTGTLEVLLDLTQGRGNSVSKSVASGSGLGGGAPVTVPSTTVPALKVP